jgi:hypothetical protein
MTFDLLATDTLTTIGFAAADVEGWYRLDDVRVEALVPEPASLVLLGGGLATWVAGRRRRRRQVE